MFRLSVQAPLLGGRLMTIDFNFADRQGKPGNVTELPAVRKTRVMRAVQLRIRDLVRTLYPHATGLKGDTARIGGLSGEAGQSLAIALSPIDSAGLWKEFNEGGGVRDSGDVFDLYALANGMTRRDLPRVIDELDAWCGGSPPAYVQKRHEALAAKPPPPVKHEEIVNAFPYLSSTGEKLFETCRIEYRDDAGNKVLRENGKPEKIYRPRRLDGSWGYPPGQWSLYRVPDIDRTQDVVLVEGEPCADALNGIGITATTAPGGSSVKPDKIDWRPLAGKTVTLWPDNDVPGIKFMNEIAAHLRTIGCTVKLLAPPPGKPEKWDAADGLAEGFDVVGFLKSEAPPAHGLSGQWIDDLKYVYEPEIVEDLIPARGVGVVFGPSSAGKSFVVVDWAMEIASGGKVLGMHTTPSGVLYFAGEGQHGLKKRIVASRRERGLDDVVLPFNVLSALLDLSKSEAKDIDRLCAYAREIAGEMTARGAPLRVVFIDTLAAAAPGANENAGEDMGPIMQAFHRMSEALGVVIVLVAHTGKDETRGIRGWSGIRANIEFAIECQVERDPDTKKVVRRSLFFEKAKDGPDGFTLTDYDLGIIEMGKKVSGNPDCTCVVQYRPPPTEPTDEEVAREREEAQRLAADELRSQVLGAIIRVSDDRWQSLKSTIEAIRAAGITRPSRDTVRGYLKTLISDDPNGLRVHVWKGYRIELQSTQRRTSQIDIEMRVLREEQ